MIDYGLIKEVLRAGIWDNLDSCLVDLESGDPRPDEQSGIKSFVSHKFTTPYIPQKGITTYDDGITTTRSAPTLTVSFTCYSRQKIEALTLASKLSDWIGHEGYHYLKGNGIIVVSMEAMTDRTTFLETHYDNRVGFDVIMRVSDRVTRQDDYIETTKVENEWIGE